MFVIAKVVPVPEKSKIFKNISDYTLKRKWKNFPDETHATKMYFLKNRLHYCSFRFLIQSVSPE